jgi:1,2-diacylglycerol 3-beta-galactosyltransferase
VEISQIISRWFKSDGIELNSMSSKAKSLGRPEATFNIVRDLAGE